MPQLIVFAKMMLRRDNSSVRHCPIPATRPFYIPQDMELGPIAVLTSTRLARVIRSKETFSNIDSYVVSALTRLNQA